VGFDATHDVRAPAERNETHVVVRGQRHGVFDVAVVLGVQDEIGQVGNDSGAEPCEIAIASTAAMPQSLLVIGADLMKLKSRR
jgi:hypothetical protein